MTLSAYIRARVVAEETHRRKHRSKEVVADKRVLAEALALLGQSRIASNFNQLAYHANIGALMIGGAEKAQIKEAYLSPPFPYPPASFSFCCMTSQSRGDSMPLFVCLRFEL